MTASLKCAQIKAKQAAKAQGLSSAQVRTSSGDVETMRVETPVERMEELRERSALSRLAAIAEGLHLCVDLFSAGIVRYRSTHRLFSTTDAPPSPSMSLPTPPTRKRRAVPLDEVAALIVKSSRVGMSSAEARDALMLLCRVSPGFVSIREIDRRLWVAAVGEASLRDTKDAIKLALAT